MATSIHSPEPSPEHRHLLLSFECNNSSSSSTQDYLAEEMLSVALLCHTLMVMATETWDTWIQIFSPTESPDWSICLLWQHHCQQAIGDTADGWVLSFGSCVTGELGTQDLECQEPQYKGQSNFVAPWLKQGAFQMGIAGIKWSWRGVSADPRVQIHSDCIYFTEVKGQNQGAKTSNIKQNCYFSQISRSEKKALCKCSLFYEHMAFAISTICSFCT